MKCFLCAGAAGGSGEILLGKLFCGACTRRIRGREEPARSPFSLTAMILALAAAFAAGYLILELWGGP